MPKKKMKEESYFNSIQFLTLVLPIIVGFLSFAGIYLNAQISPPYGDKLVLKIIVLIFWGTLTFSSIVAIVRREVAIAGLPNIKGISAIIYGIFSLIMVTLIIILVVFTL